MSACVGRAAESAGDWAWTIELAASATIDAIARLEVVAYIVCPHRRNASVYILSILTSVRSAFQFVAVDGTLRGEFRGNPRPVHIFLVLNSVDGDERRTRYHRPAGANVLQLLK